MNDPYNDVDIIKTSYKRLFYTVQKIKFFIKDLVTFTEEILNWKLHFCSVLGLFNDSGRC